MKDLKEEIRHKFEKFETAWQSELPGVIKSLGKADKTYFQSYLQLVSLNTWRSELLTGTISVDSVSFFLEADNDVLVAHVVGRMGAWRSASKSLRSCLENVAFGLYFKDHPVELAQWKMGKFKPGFSSTIEYLTQHPAFDGIDPSISGLDVLKKEYGILSKAVHGSSPFQMTAETGTTSLWTASLQSLGKWRTRERIALQAINLLLITMFREQLHGTQRPQLRKAVSFAVSPSKHPIVKSVLGASLTAPG